MVQLGTLAAALLFLIPVVVVVALVARRDTELWELAVAVPSAVALDLLLVAVLALAFRLDVATLVARGLWLVAGSGLIVRRRRRGGVAWPARVTPRVVVVVALCAAVALLLSMQASRPYSMWDRRWHIPLVASLRGQRIPFHNVFDPSQPLHYHFSGDMHAAMLQALSFSVLHAALGLSLAHDIHFALIGASLALLMSYWGHRRIVAFVLAPAAVLFAGPLTILRNGVRTAQHGYSLINYLSASFRPHLSLSGLLLLGLVGAVMPRLARSPAALPRRVALPLLACSAALAITDETSLGLFGIALGAVWLFSPHVLHDSRLRGFGILLGMAAALIVPNLLFGGSLSPGGEHHTVSLVPWRSPGCYTPALPLSTAKGRQMLLYDVFPLLAIVVGLLLHYLTRHRSRERGTWVLFLSVMTAVGVVLLTRLDVDHAPLENHRFMVAPMFLAPVLGVLFLSPGRTWEERAWRPSPYAVFAIAAGLTLGALSTADWLWTMCPGWANTYQHFYANIDHYKVDCRRETDARNGLSARAYYMAEPVWYLYAGCVPTFGPGVARGSHWKTLTIGEPVFGASEERALEKWSADGLRTAAVICPLGRQKEPMCARAVARGGCKPLGTYAQRCEVP